MKPPPRIPIFSLPLRPRFPPSRRAVHSTTSQPAKVASLIGSGPPPEPPVTPLDARVARRRKQAELLAQAREIRAAASGKKSSTPGSGGLRRFWKDVSVKEVDGSYQIYLDTRPVRHPTTKLPLLIPLSKPHLASALALEWDLLTSASQATKTHLIPLTSLVARALDILAADAAHSGPAFPPPLRTAITATLLRYLDTDSLLCWAPHPPPDQAVPGVESLRERQERAAGAIARFMSTHVWPGVELAPVLDGQTLVPRRQAAGVREVVQGWVMGLSGWELAGLERGVLAGKGLVGAARLVAEWSEGPAGVRTGRDGDGEGEEERKRFGVEEAARVASLEVDFQTGQWGEVEDTHDVEKEDLRRQLGSVVLLVSGTGESG